MQASEDEDDEDDEDDEEGVKSAPPSPTPVARRVRQNTIYGQRREATIPSHGLPSASLSPGMNMASPLPSASRGKKRSRDEEPMRIKKEKETITTTDDGEEDGDEELTMAQRAKQVKKMRLVSKLPLLLISRVLSIRIRRNIGSTQPTTAFPLSKMVLMRIIECDVRRSCQIRLIAATRHGQ